MAPSKGAGMDSDVSNRESGRSQASRAGWSWLDRLLPVDLVDDPHAVRRGRIALVTTLALAGILGAALVLRLRIGPLDQLALSVAVASIAALALMPVVLRLTGSIEIVTRSTTAIVVFLLLSQVYWAGGVGAPASVLLILVPLLVAHLVGAPTGRWAMVAVCVAVIAFTVQAIGSERLGHPLDPQGEAVARGLWLFTAILLVWILSRSYERQRTALEEQLQQSQILYRRLFAQSKDVVALATVDGQLIDVNHAGVELYGFESREAMLATDTRTFYVEPQERAELVRRLREDGFAVNYQSRHRTIDGRLIIVQGTTTSILDDQGVITHLLTIMRDVTDEIESAAALERKNTELERFTSAVSHDLKNPIFTVLSLLDLADDELRSGNTEQVLEDLGQIVRTVEKMNEMVERMLALARLGASELEWEELDLEEVLREVEELLIAQLRQTGVVLSLAPDLPTVRGDRALLRTMFQNLVENAIKFLDGHTDPRIDVGWRAGDQKATVSVCDNGPGIAKEDQERLFGLFEQLDTDVQGTGIGLATVRKVIDLHQGEVWVESAGRGAGSCFYLTLPSLVGTGQPESTGSGGGSTVPSGVQGPHRAIRPRP